VAWLSAFPLFVLFGANDFRAAFFAQNPQRSIETAAWSIFYAMYVLVGTILIVALVRSRGASRVRLRWVIAALLCFVVQIPIQAGLDAVGLSGQLSYVVGSLFTIAGFAILAYAIVRHALFDIAFIINQAAIYAVLTGVVVAVFAALNWSVGTALRNTGLGIPVEVAFAGALGLTLNVVHRRLDRLVERVFFRRRFEAQSRLARVARALANVTEDRLTGEALVDEPYEAFDLAGAAFYRRGDADGVYLLAACRGWAEHAVPSVAADARFLLHIGGSTVCRFRPGFLADARGSRFHYGGTTAETYAPTRPRPHRRHDRSCCARRGLSRSDLQLRDPGTIDGDEPRLLSICVRRGYGAAVTHGFRTAGNSLPEQL
jgi:hypothetical protein